MPSQQVIGLRKNGNETAPGSGTNRIGFVVGALEPRRGSMSSSCFIQPVSPRDGPRSLTIIRHHCPNADFRLIVVSVILCARPLFL